MKHPALLLLLPLLATAACTGSPRGAQGAIAPGESRTFEGQWSATGTRHTLRLESGHQASIITLTGAMLLVGERGLGVGFRAEVIGMSDNQTGGEGRSVWTDERGDQVFSRLRGQPIATGSHVVGTITGGTGRFAGLTGEYEFRWRYVIDSDEGTISGQTVDLKGKVTATPAGKAGG